MIVVLTCEYASVICVEVIMCVLMDDRHLLRKWCNGAASV